MKTPLSETDQITLLLIRLHEREELCSRAADALEVFDAITDRTDIAPLIAELRKTTQ